MSYQLFPQKSQEIYKSVQENESSSEINRFHDYCREVRRFQGTKDEQKYRFQLGLEFQYVESVKSTKYYIENWLRCLYLSADQEELFCYIFRNNILNKSYQFYLNWMYFYVHRKEYILASHVVNLSASNLNKCEVIFENAGFDLGDRLCQIIKESLSFDFYRQDFYIANVNSSEEDFRSAGLSYESFGISQNDFLAIKKVKLDEKIWCLNYEEGVFEQKKNEKKGDYNDGLKPYPSFFDWRLNFKEKVKFEKVINEIINPTNTYIDPIVAEDVFPGYIIRAYEYEFLKRQYWCFTEGNKENMSDNIQLNSSKMCKIEKKDDQFDGFEGFSNEKVSNSYNFEEMGLLSNLQSDPFRDSSWHISFSDDDIKSSQTSETYDNSHSNKNSISNNEEILSNGKFGNKMTMNYGYPVFKKATLIPQKIELYKFEQVEKFRAENDDFESEGLWN